MSRSRITAVQSVYIAADENRAHHPSPRSLLAALSLLVVLSGAPALAGVVFDNCQPTADGGVTCDTRATGNTRLDAFDARYGLLDEASPGWNEFEPFQGDDDMFGGNET